MSGDIVISGAGDVQLASNRERLGMLLNSLQYAGQPPTKMGYMTQPRWHLNLGTDNIYQ